MAKKVQQVTANSNTGNLLDNLHPVVTAISQIEFQGNVIPHSWWHSEKLRFNNGQPNFTAILILADICYWYRATEKRDATGQIIELRQKFGADKLQKSYHEWANQFDLNKRQIQDAVAFLIERGLVKRELRSFESRGVMLYNVTFFEPNAAAIQDLAICNTLSRQDVGGITSGRDTPPATTGHPTRRNVIPITSGRDTYTNTRQKNAESRQRGGSVYVAGATPADADTHAPPATSSASKKSKGEKRKQAEPEGEEIRLTDDQMAAYKIFLAYFPGLGTSGNFKDVARYVRDQNIHPGPAALMCGWLQFRERKFKFMKPALFRDLWEEFTVADQSDVETVKNYCWQFGGRMSDVKAVYAAWQNGGAAK
jgi:hypothetical protein